jgi:hypothetical protein
MGRAATIKRNQGIGMAVSIAKTEFDGLEAVEISTSKARLVAVTAMGPRIAHFGTRLPGGREGKNLLYWDYPRKYHRGPWRLMGGHRIWATRPGADEGEETYAEDNQACKVKLTAKGVELHGGVHPVHRTSKSLLIKVLADDTLQVDNRITNHSEMIWSGGVWSLTCTLPKAATTFGIPLGREGAWDIFVIGYPKTWGGQTSLVNDPAVRLTENCMIIKPQGRVGKKMVLAPQGIIGMTDPGEKISFLKQVDYVDGADYPMGCNLAYYAGKKNFMLEMESMGPNQSVLPGASITSRETWMLRKPIVWSKLKGVLKPD